MKQIFWALFLILCIPTSVFAAVFSTNDPYMDELWYRDAIHVPAQTSDGRASLVAILDAGFDLDHEDLINQYWKNSGEIKGDHMDNDHNGYEDDVIGWDFVDQDPDPSPVITKDGSDAIISHGTLLAGIIAAEANNSRGIAGISPHSNIMPLRILDSRGVGNTADVRAAIEYAVRNGADVINLSLTSTKSDEKLQKVIEWAVDQGVVVVAAIGNDALDTDKTPTYPACFDARLGKNIVLGVAALTQDLTKADFSNDGTNCVDISAPGVNVFGLAHHDPTNLLYSTAYGSPWEGTSIAAPMVTGAVAQLRSAYPTLTPDQIRLSLMLSADPTREIDVAAHARLGAGVLNVERALKTAAVFATGSSIPRNTHRHPTGSIVVAQARGSEPLVKRLNQSGKELVSFLAYHKKFRGGVRLAMGDVTGDGTEEIITAPGPGGGPHIRVFDVEGHVLNQFFAFETNDRQGVFVATGDLNGDGVDEILVTQDEGGTGQVRIFNRKGEMQGAFYPFGRISSAVHVAVGNMDDDAGLEIVTTLGGKDQEHRVKIFDSGGQYVREFKASGFNGAGLDVSILHPRGQSMDQVLLGAEAGAAPWFAVYSALGEQVYTSLAYAERFLGGVNFASGDIDQNGSMEIYVVPQTGGGPHVRVFNNITDPIGSFFPFDPKSRSGLSIAIWNP